MSDAQVAEPNTLGEGRRVICVEEYGEVPIPVELLLSGSQLKLYPGLAKTGIVRTYVRNGDLIFQVGGFVGFLPINDHVALEIAPRVPIVNLERILLLADADASIVLANHARSFSVTQSGISPSFLDFLTDRLIVLVEKCAIEGLHYEYARRRREGQNPAGRILPYQTIQGRRKSGGHLKMVSDSFERTHDTAPNQCIAAALNNLYKIYCGMRDRSGKRARVSRLARARRFFDRVSETSIGALLTNPLVSDPTKLPSSRPSYPDALSISKLVISKIGVDIRDRTGQVSLPPMLFNLEDAFEKYLRNVLRDNASGFRVLDGNLAQPVGARKKLFHSTPAESPYLDTYACPDIVCESLESKAQIVIDVKYKPSVSRDDINQVLGYALTFQSNTVVIASPRSRVGSEVGLILLGKIGAVKVFNYFFDLSVTDLEGEEARFSNEVVRLMTC